MNWKVRHEGSPESVEMTLDELRQGLLDGAWQQTDEVMGPDDTDWVAIENHPALAETVEELEPPLVKHHPDETHLDMNALIDVCLVLLVFFILTTTVAAMQKRMEAPTVEEKDKKNRPKVVVLTQKQVEEQMIVVTAKMEGGRPVVRVADKEIDPDRLTAELRSFVKASGKTEVLLQHDDDVPHDLVVRIIDAAKGAGVYRVRVPVP